MRCPHCGAEIASLQVKFIDELPAAEQVALRLSGQDKRSDTQPCPSCGQELHVRRHPRTREVFLLSKEDALSLDSLRLANLYLKVCDDSFARFVTRTDGTYRPDDERSAAKLIWGVLDRRRLAAANKGDWNTAGKLALEKARYRCSMGKPFFSIKRDAMRFQLLDLQARGAAKVRIVAARDGMVCPACAKNAGRVLTVEEALKEMPLPTRCDNAGRRVKIEHDHGWCRCLYVRQS